jgi:Bacterial Ig-like domain
VHQSDLKLLDSNDMTVLNAFMDFGQELWSPDGRRLTVLFDPGKVKRGVEAPDSELSPLKEGKIYKITLGEAHYTFRVGPAVRKRIDPALWLISTGRPLAQSVDIQFDRVMDPALLEDQLGVEDDKSRPIAGSMRVTGGGRGLQFRPAHRLKNGSYQIKIRPLLEDVAGNQISETLDHAVSDVSGESAELVIAFVVR